MKVTHIFWGLTYGGIETMLVNIANEQAKLGAVVSIVIINEIFKPELLNNISNEVKMICINRKVSSKGLGFIRDINKELNILNPDVIHLHRSEIRNFISARRARMSCIVSTIHDIPTGKVGMSWRWGNILSRIIFHETGNVGAVDRVDKVFAISHAVAESLKSKYHIQSEVVVNGIITSKFKKRDMSCSVGPFRMVQVSRLDHEKKGQDLLIKAIAEIKDKYNKKVNVTFIGDGASRKYLESLVSEKGLAEHVFFLGSKTQEYISLHLKEYDLFVQPSRMEGFGLTVAEAMAAGVPLLVARGQGPSEVTEGDRYGWTFANGDVMELVEKINFLMDNYGMALEKAQSAWLHVRNKYDVSVTARTYIEKYRETLHQKLQKYTNYYIQKDLSR